MGLQVWLPLIEDLRNQGLAQSASFGTTDAFATNGKLGGKSLYSNAQKTATFIELNNVTNFSFAYWIKVDSSVTIHNYADIIGLQCVVGNTTTIIRGEFSNAAGQHNLYIGKDSTVGGNTNTYYNIGADSSVAKDKWAHIAIVKDNSNVYTYLNGVLTKTTSNSNFENSPQKLTGLVYLGNTSSTAAQINDFRIYDHCLTENEVKRLAQGLILHYPLNRGGWGQENLHKNSDTLNSWHLEQATLSNGVATITPTSGNNRRIYQMPAEGDWDWQANTKYTVSIEAKSTNGAELIFAPYGGSTAESSAITVTSDWKRYSYSFTTGSSPTTRSMTYKVNQTSGVSLQLRYPKFEMGSIATPWCPNSADTAYTTMGLNGTTEYDCSGFCNNGTRNGTFSWTSDTPKYCVSTGIEKGIINSTNSFVTTADPVFSVALWFKLKSGVSYTSYTDLISFSSSNYSNQPFRLEICGSPVGKSIDWFRGPSGQTGGFEVGSNLSFDTWYHTVLVSEGNKQYTYYLNGEKKGTYNGSANTWTPTGNVSLGENINGVLYESDFRIYATALSADDVKSLYQNCATIGPDGTIYGKIR